MAIESETAALRLARAILSDLRKYNAAKIAAGGDVRAALAEEIEEGRALFRTRVSADLHALFERELETFDFAQSAAPRGRVSWAIAAACVVLALAAAGWALLSR